MSLTPNQLGSMAADAMDEADKLRTQVAVLRDLVDSLQKLTEFQRRQIEVRDARLVEAITEFERRRDRDRALAQGESGVVGFAATAAFAGCYNDVVNYLKPLVAPQITEQPKVRESSI